MNKREDACRYTGLDKEYSAEELAAFGKVKEAGEFSATLEVPRQELKSRSIAILVFLSICAAFFLVPLYVIITTSFKTMAQIREGAIFSLPSSAEKPCSMPSFAPT